MISPQTVLVRTQAGSALLHTSESDLSRTERLLLIMVNGNHCVADISTKLYSIPLRRLIEALALLLSRGLVCEGQSELLANTPIKRHELEAFLRTDELDPTTAMIADFELQAALNEGVEVGNIKSVHQAQAILDLDARILAKTNNRKPSFVSITPNIQTQQIPHSGTRLLQTLKPKDEASLQAPIVRSMAGGKHRGWFYMLVFAFVWCGMVWYVRHR